jgi:hypothetical protein
MRNSDESQLADIASATFTLIDRDTGVVIIDAAGCQSVAGGVLLYYPATGELPACRFLAQFTAFLTGGAILPSQHFEGEIQENL